MSKSYLTTAFPFPETPTTELRFPPPGYEPFLDVEEVTRAIVPIHPKTLMKWAREGRVVGHRIGRRWFFRASELTASLISSAKINPANVPA